MGRELKKSISQKLRMTGRDYSRPGWYFLTLGADKHRSLFGRVEQGAMVSNELGRLVARCWCAIPAHYSHIELGAWQVMPNHFHGLIRLVGPNGKGLGEVVNMFKGSVTREWRRAQGVYAAEGARHGEKEPRLSGQIPGKVWAPNYWDVICFNAEELAVRERYVRANPKRWALRDVSRGDFLGGRYCGNLSLLDAPSARMALRVSRRASERDLQEKRLELDAFAGVVFSTFFSAGERACLSQLLAGNTRVVWVVPMALPKQIPVAWTDAFLAGRALWVSNCSEAIGSRASCDEANEWVERLAEG